MMWQALICAAVLLGLTALKILFPAESGPLQRGLLQAVQTGVDYRGAVTTLGRVLTGQGTMAEVLRQLTIDNGQLTIEDDADIDAGDAVPGVPQAGENVRRDTAHDEPPAPAAAEPLSATWVARSASLFSHLAAVEESGTETVALPLTADLSELNVIARTVEDDTLPLPFGAVLPERVSFTHYPVTFPTTLPVNGRITSPFGYRNHPVEGGTSFHYGVDIGGVPSGASIRAFADGTVETVSRNAVYGNFVVLRHAGGFSTFYGHAGRITVRAGQNVKMGDEIGRVGQTGMATGPHLHFEVRLCGQILNPAHYLTL
jgi:murein DD-endopeptidase MepM/ murein hydrolase activator NlpD